ncbi:hypothetical protein T03_5320 [Trichinella britovi]|uniref:Uncharacterized protein n=1 Tax=Trichinella britovi TaxID=45882 RepID=A0A0V1CHE8_TRIBR|nr:hypothetical protein T03_5320 [Trichinella britovi]
MKGVDRRQFQTFCRSVFNPLWFKGSMDEWMEFAFFLHQYYQVDHFDGLWFFYGLVLNPE